MHKIVLRYVHKMKFDKKGESLKDGKYLYLRASVAQWCNASLECGRSGNDICP